MTTPLQQQIASLRAEAAQPGADVVGIATRLAALSGQLTGSDAVAAQQAAVDVLTAFDPLVATASFDCMILAEQLHDLAVRQLADGQADAGEATARQAIATYQQAAGLPDPAIESIAANLTTLDKQLNHAGDVADALAAQQAAVAVLSIPDPADADAAREQLLADALFTLAARLVDARQAADAAVKATEAADTYGAVLAILRAGLAASARALASLGRQLAAQGLTDVAALAQQAVALVASADPAAVLPVIASGSAVPEVVQAAAQVSQAGVLLSRAGAIGRELADLAALMTSVGQPDAAQHVLDVATIRPLNVPLTGTQSYSRARARGAR